MQVYITFKKVTLSRNFLNISAYMQVYITFKKVTLSRNFLYILVHFLYIPFSQILLYFGLKMFHCTNFKDSPTISLLLQKHYSYSSPVASEVLKTCEAKTPFPHSHFLSSVSTSSFRFFFFNQKIQCIYFLYRLINTSTLLPP